MKTKRSKEGYLMVDHRASPGLTPADMAKIGLAGHPGYEAGTLYERAMIPCGHCPQTVIRNPLRTRDRAWCSGCDSYLCDPCGLLQKLGHACTPTQKTVDTLFSRAGRTTEV